LPGGQCCGNGVCQSSDESPCVCASDCGSPAAAEVSCSNQQDDDCDGAADCGDADCCGDGSCTQDADGDGRVAPCDCDDTSNLIWGTPGESTGLSMLKGGAGEAFLGWQSPTQPGGSVLVYDTLRTLDPSNFASAAQCLPAPNPSQPANEDVTSPPADQVYYY